MNDRGISRIGSPPPTEPKPLDARLTEAATHLRVTAAGLLVVDTRGVPVPLASSLPAAHDLDTFQLGSGDGPAVEAFRTGTAEVNVAPVTAGARWPAFARAAQTARFPMAHALAVLRAGTPIGVLTLYQRQVRPLDPAGRHLAQLFATTLVATAMRDRAMHRLRETTDQVGLLLYRLDLLIPHPDPHGADSPAARGPIVPPVR